MHFFFRNTRIPDKKQTNPVTPESASPLLALEVVNVLKDAEFAYVISLMWFISTYINVSNLSLHIDSFANIRGCFKDLMSYVLYKT